MSFLIGGFSSEQYKAYLDPTSEQKPQWHNSHWAAHLARYPILAVLVNRMAYCLLHRFAVYPNNAYLFQKFKSHDFTKIETEAECEIAKEIFACFQHCAGLVEIEVSTMEAQLNEIEERLREEFVDEQSVDKEEGKSVKNSDQNNDDEEAELLNKKTKDEKASDLDAGQDSSQDSSSDKTADGKQDQEKNLKTPVLKLDAQIPVFQSQPDNKQLKANDEEGSPDLNDSSDSGEDVSSFTSEEEDTNTNIVPPLILDDTTERLNAFLEELSNSQIEENGDETSETSDDEETEWSFALPKEVDDILSQPFPLDDPKSINDLFQGENSHAEKALYRNNLTTLILFAIQVQAENSKVDDDRFEDYMKKLDSAFQRAWTEAYQETDALHAEFAAAFPQKPAILDNKGEIVCNITQLQWVTAKIAERFPAIYQLAFDVPSLGIYQSIQMASLARAIFVGQDANDQGAEIDSPCCICIRATLGKHTPELQDSRQENPLVKAGSFIYTLFAGPNGKIIKEVGKLKKQLEGCMRAYVKGWFEQPGVVLEFGDIAIKGGQGDETIKAGEWVAYVRDSYTKTLKDMTQEKLQEEIKKVMQCPFVHLIAKAYVNDIETKAWATSRFPATLMKELFREELKMTKGKSKIHQAISQTIDHASFTDEQDVEDLAKKAGCTSDLIEPLIRIRILYMIYCLGQNVIEPAVHGINQRAKTMYDPSICENLKDPILVCSSEERTLSFDDKFDCLTLKVKTNFNDPKKVQVVAQGISTLTVESLNRSVTEKIETWMTDLEELRFSLYSSPEQMRYLVAQIAPQTFLKNVQKLAQEMANVALVKKAKRYETAKQDHNSKRSTWQILRQGNLFDLRSYQEPDLDNQNLDEAISKAKELVTYLNTERMLAYSNQLSQKDDQEYNSAIAQIRNEFNKISHLLGEIYAVGNPDNDTWKAICKKSKQLKELLEITSEEIGVIVESSESESSRSVTPLSSDEEIENEIIGKMAGTVQKSYTNHLWNYTFGYLLNETSKVQYLKWKIERYEDLITGVQKGIIEYLEEKKLGGVKDFIKKAKEANAPEWMKHLLPIVTFANKNVREDEQRLNPDYLNEVRVSYTENMLITLREAATWAKAHPTMPGVEHINAICYQLYATLNLNDCCQKVVNTFLKLGKSAIQEANKASLPGDPRYAMLNDLYEANEQIHAVPNEAKAPIIKQWANSLRGHLNGIWGMTTFDPNLQSNPIHVFFNKIIKKKGSDAEGFKVKDIAMGSPTIEIGNGAAEINPEFEGCLRHCQHLGLKHLYINNQNFTATSWVKGNEASRCKTLHDLAEKDFKETLFVITLNQNTSFYQQRYDLNKTIMKLNGVREELEMNAQKVKDALIVDLLKGKSKHYLPAHLMANVDLHQWMEKKINEIHQDHFGKCEEFSDEKIREQFIQHFHNELRQYVEQSLTAFPAPDGKGLGYSIYYSGAKEFKEEFIAQLFDRQPIETGNYIPEDLVTRFDLRNWSADAIDQIHNKLFGSRKNLTIEERRIFIRMVYQNLAQKVLIETGANSYNASCKDRIDRGAATDAEDFAYLAVLADCMNEPHVIEFFKMLVFARAIIVRKRTIIEERLERLIESVKFMIDHQKQLQELHHTLFPDVEVTIDQFNLVDLEPKEEEIDNLYDY